MILDSMFPSILEHGTLSPEQATQARSEALSDLYLFTKAVLGFDRLVYPLHREMCDKAMAMHDPSRNMILYPRGHFKSTVFSIAYPLWMLCRDPNLRILLVGAKADNAEHFLGKIKRTIEQNANFRALFPDRCPPDTTKTVWTQKEILLPRQRDYPEYSIETAGVGASVTSRHYDIIVKDDLINEDTYQSPTEMLRVIDWHLFSNSLFMDVQSGIDVVVGTLWPSTNDIYTHIRTKEPEYHISKRSALEGGESIFPERFPVKALLALRDKDPVKFACFAAGTLVTTENGLVPIETIQIKTKVLTHEGRYRPVTRIFEQEAATLLDLKFYGLYGHVRSTPEHPFLTERGWIEAKDLSLSDHLVLPTLSAQSVANPWLPEDPERYWLYGFYLGDGGLAANKAVGFAFNHEDHRLIDKVQDIIKRKLGRRGTIHTQGSATRIYVGEPTLFKLAVASDRPGNGQKEIPWQLEFAPKQCLEALWEGYFAADGYTYRECRGVNSVAFRLLCQFQRILWKLGSDSSISSFGGGGDRLIMGRLCNTQPLHRISVNDGATHRSKRGRLHKIDTLDGPFTVYNLEVEEDNSYVLYNQVVHNCQYQNEPHTSGVAEFRQEWLQYYTYEKRESTALVIKPNGQPVPIGTLNRYLRIDPALTALGDMKPGSTPSRSAIVVDGVAANGDIFVLEAWAAFVDPRDLISKFFELHNRWRPIATGIERVAYQKVLKYWIEERAAAQGKYVRIVELVPDTKQSKEARIRTGVAESFGEQKVYVRRDLTDFLEEYRLFPQTGAFRDLLDAFAYGPQMWRAPVHDDDEPLDDDGIPTIEALRGGRSLITGY